jgi:3-methyladenine DNA glycosylase/8-oxoguanine DNA glycosylase
MIGESALRTVCRVGYRAPTLHAIGEYFRQIGDSPEPESSIPLIERLLIIRYIGPYSAGVIAHAVMRDPRAAGLDWWNTRLAAELFGLGDQASKETVSARLSKNYPGFEGMTLLYITEAAYLILTGRSPRLFG